MEDISLVGASFNRQDSIDGSKPDRDKGWPALINLVRASSNHIIVCSRSELDTGVAATSEEVGLLKARVVVGGVNHD